MVFFFFVFWQIVVELVYGLLGQGFVVVWEVIVFLVGYGVIFEEYYEVFYFGMVQVVYVLVGGVVLVLGVEWVGNGWGVQQCGDLLFVLFDLQFGYGIFLDQVVLIDGLFVDDVVFGGGQGDGGD